MTSLEDQVAAVLRPIVASLYVDSDRHAEITAEVISLVSGAIADEIEARALEADTFQSAFCNANENPRVSTRKAFITAAKVVRGSVSPPLEPATTETDAVL